MSEDQPKENVMRTFAVLSLALLAGAGLSVEARIPRSNEARLAFVRQQVCPSTQRHRLPCPGYVIDHVIPLAYGGADDPSNMQWQTVADGKAKDRVERRNCTRPAGPKSIGPS